MTSNTICRNTRNVSKRTSSFLLFAPIFPIQWNHSGQNHLDPSSSPDPLNIAQHALNTQVRAAFLHRFKTSL